MRIEAINAEIEAIRARADAATPGPWTTSDTTYGKAIHCLPSPDSSNGYLALTEASPQAAYVVRRAAYSWYTKEQADANAEFIAHARGDIPALLAENAGLRQQLAEARADVRAFSCPAQWLQRRGQPAPPSWVCTRWGDSFRHCWHYDERNVCWDCWDRQPAPPGMEGMTP